MFDCDDKTQFTLSAKIVKKMTTEEFGYELSANAFELLNRKAKENLMKGDAVEDVNNCILQVLKQFRGKKIVKKCDIEAVIGEIEKENNSDDEELLVENDHFSDIEEKMVEKEHNTDIEQFKIEKQLEVDIEELIVEIDASSEISSEVESTVDDTKCIRHINIVQLPSDANIKELEEEIERLKKIIQIILNKQAELV